MWNWKRRELRAEDGRKQHLVAVQTRGQKDDFQQTDSSPNMTPKIAALRNLQPRNLYPLERSVPLTVSDMNLCILGDVSALQHIAAVRKGDLWFTKPYPNITK
ncbi:unnamed protein product [Pleuronectes platessa]|uniref:Uncharacterized protein n=1 Tax=Pleuronectes platessa TaxID=8262 RepID=A0A9N7U6H1_PLEPL|nr:unnamed protein product [Pleuronectes platessa]